MSVETSITTVVLELSNEDLDAVVGGNSSTIDQSNYNGGINKFSPVTQVNVATVTQLKSEINFPESFYPKKHTHLRATAPNLDSPS